MFEGSYVIDKFSLILKGLFILVTYLTFLLSVNFVESDEYYQGEYYFLLLSSLLGALVVTSSRDLLTMFIGIELASTPMFLLSGWKKAIKNQMKVQLNSFYWEYISIFNSLWLFTTLWSNWKVSFFRYS